MAEDIVGNMVQALVKELAPEKIILFGSRAKGTATESSDVDLIVIEREPFGETRSRTAEIQRAYEALRGSTVPCDVLVYSLKDVEFWKDSINNVLARALREGKVLYERY